MSLVPPTCERCILRFRWRCEWSLAGVGGWCVSSIYTSHVCTLCVSSDGVYVTRAFFHCVDMNSSRIKWQAGRCQGEDRKGSGIADKAHGDRHRFHRILCVGWIGHTSSSYTASLGKQPPMTLFTHTVTRAQCLHTHSWGLSAVLIHHKTWQGLEGMDSAMLSSCGDNSKTSLHWRLYYENLRHHRRETTGSVFRNWSVFLEYTIYIKCKDKMSRQSTLRTSEWGSDRSSLLHW